MTDIRDLSKEYLIKFLQFEKKALGYEPIIIGGWAVYALTQKEQSVDVDILLKSKKDIEKIKPFFDEQNFKMESTKKAIIFEKTQEPKQDIQGVEIESIIFDIMTIEEPNKIRGVHDIEIPWQLAFQHNVTIKLENLKIKIPSPELLLLYKTAAYLGRSFDKFKFQDHMNNRKIWIKRKDFKIEKDKRDIQNLINSGKINIEKLEELLKETKFKEEYEIARKEIMR